MDKCYLKKKREIRKEKAFMRGRDKKWIGDLEKGGLHKSLGVPMGKKIPQKKIIQAEHSSSPKERKQAFAAETLKKLRPHRNRSR
jgi:hypothetical protein